MSLSSPRHFGIRSARYAAPEGSLRLLSLDGSGRAEADAKGLVRPQGPVLRIRRHGSR